jgi:CheY-like chemotaxis protein
MTRQELSVVILVVDDDDSVRVSTARLLSAHGYMVVEAESAAVALQRAAEIQPDVILMDLHMPRANGMDAARQFKQHAQLRDTPIVAISATPPEWVHESDLFATVLHKPYVSSQLLAVLTGVVRR